MCGPNKISKNYTNTNYRNEYILTTIHYGSWKRAEEGGEQMMRRKFRSTLIILGLTIFFFLIKDSIDDAGLREKHPVCSGFYVL